MNQQEMIKIVKHLGISAPLKLNNPHRGWLGYMLRCKAEPEEHGKNTFLIKAPEGGWECTRLSNNQKEREAMSYAWAKLMPKELIYIAINVEPVNPNDNVWENTFLEMTESELISITKLINENIATMLPSFSLSAVVWHAKQIVGDGGYRPIHAHFMVGGTNATPDEAKIICER